MVNDFNKKLPLRIYNRSTLDLIAIIKEYNSLQVDLLWGAKVSTFELHLDPKYFNYFAIDNLIYFASVMESNKYEISDVPFIIKTIELTDDGLVVKGQHIIASLNDNYIYYHQGDAHYNRAGMNLGTVLMNMISDLTSGTDTLLNTNNTEIDANSFITTDKTVNQHNVGQGLDSIQSILYASPSFERYGIYINTNFETKKHEIMLYEGVDKTQTLIFSKSRKNLASYRYTIDTSGEKNWFWANIFYKLTANSEDTQVVAHSTGRFNSASASSGPAKWLYVEVSGLSLDDNSNVGWNEMTTAQRNEILQKAYQTIQSRYQNFLRTDNVEFKVSPTFSFSNYNLGDKTTLVIDEINQVFTQRITELKLSWEDNGFSCDIVTGTPTINLNSRLNKKMYLDNIKNNLKQT